MALDRRTARRAVRGALWGLTAVHLAEALLLRQRREAVMALPPAGDGADGGDKVRVLSLAGAGVDDATRAAALADLELRGDELVDLIPGDLPVGRWLRLLRRVDPADLGNDAMKSAPGVAEAAVAHRALAERMGIEADEALDRGALARLTQRAQRYAPTAHSLRLAPGVTAGPVSPEDRWRELEAVTAFTWPYGAWAPLLAAAETAHLALMTAGVVVSPGAALAALATWSAQPAIALAPPVGEAQSFSSAELGRAGVRRLARGWTDNLRTLAAGFRATRAREAQRAATPLPPVPPLSERFEPRRDTCAWCGSAALAGRVDLPDLLLHRPGEFHLDECRDCGHIFQNPALTPAGLDYYYQDAYEGIGEELAEVSFAALGRNYRSRVASLARYTEPRALLDVGTGHAHFLLTAREQWPDTTFDALDISESIDEAKRRGRVDNAYRGLFPDLANTLGRTYDAVCMHHYLEHTKDPRREIEAVLKVLEPGGYLMIEMPDAQHHLSHTLGRYWWQWAQPQHQHFITCENLCKELEESGFEVLSVERGPVTLGGDLFNAVALFLQAHARSPHLPWLPRPSLAHQVKRYGLYTAALPLLAATKLIDAARDANATNDTPGNSYRLVARRR